ncbi:MULTISPECIES: NAD(P)/FAD-dependent oxidoreductase [unclassified Mesorhizobium]|uniref:NAD(P)/FAD-dependent oxidoreductase n=1 Tax=unclassified Mesorhizobium TaxID=325217 RepID=UPI001CCF4DE2|nr:MULTISPECIES: FAD-binding oxidoreductase [unclassified Mesorhizobium]MBZ9738820.1 FAD-binding oxidoreductase [Mesorhizobium sp. CO1-1-4]MBZ9802878.1 FAD-binding oxidoreductase [Mesorhizobium sp. ES1-6]
MLESSPPRSLYRETASGTGNYPSLAGAQRARVAIVGGGFTGLSTALHLAEAGDDVCVLEAHQPGSGASGRNGGQVNPGLKYDPDTIEAMFGSDLGSRMIDFSYSAPDFTFDLIKRLSIECEARQNGTIRAAVRPKPEVAVRTTAAQCVRRGMPVEMLDAEAMAARTGTDRYISGMFDARGGDLHPLKYTLGLAAAAQNDGARIFGDSEVLSLGREAGRWLLKTASGSVSADKVLVATNGYTGALWPGLEQSLVPVFSAIAATEPLPQAVAAAILPHRPVVYEAGNITVYYRIDARNRLLMGGRGPMRPIGDASAIRYLTDYAPRLWPALAGTAWTHGWNGRVAITGDHLPHVHEPEDGVLICLGYNGRGVAMASAMGKALANRLRGDATAPFPMPISGLKPIRFHRFWPLGVKAAILSGRVKDRFGL